MAIWYGGVTRVGKLQVSSNRPNAIALGLSQLPVELPELVLLLWRSAIQEDMVGHLHGSVVVILIQYTCAESGREAHFL